MRIAALTAVAALSLLASTSGATARPVGEAASVCPARIAPHPSPDGEGTIERLLTQAEAMNLLSRTQATVGAPIDGAYINNVRAIVRRDDGAVRTVLLPYDMEAGVGDRVAFQTGYASPPPLCSYVPALATAILPPG